MSLEFNNFNKNNIIEDKQSIKSIEIPKKELECLGDIYNYVSVLSEAETTKFNGPIIYPEGAIQKENELFQQKKSELENNWDWNEDRYNIPFKARRYAEYEARKEVIDYKNHELEQLIEFIEKQEIWKNKFSTASNINYNKNICPDFNSFISDLEKSEEEHKLYSEAGQNLNSIYYVANSGMAIRIKLKDLHWKKGNIKSALQVPFELSFCVDTINNPEEEDLFRSPNKFSSKMVSFKPKVGYNVEEFISEDFLEAYKNPQSDFKSKIEIVKDKDNITIKNYYGTHNGHYINKIYF